MGSAYFENVWGGRGGGKTFDHVLYGEEEAEPMPKAKGNDRRRKGNSTAERGA